MKRRESMEQTIRESKNTCTRMNQEIHYLLEEEENRKRVYSSSCNMARYKRPEMEWWSIEQQALRELSESQRQSTMCDVLKKIKIRMIISNKL